MAGKYEKDFKNTNKCQTCSKNYECKNVFVNDQCHLTGKCREVTTPKVYNSDVFLVNVFGKILFGYYQLDLCHYISDPGLYWVIMGGNNENSWKCRIGTFSKIHKHFLVEKGMGERISHIAQMEKKFLIYVD